MNHEIDELLLNINYLHNHLEHLAKLKLPQIFEGLSLEKEEPKTNELVQLISWYIENETVLYEKLSTILSNEYPDVIERLI